MKKILAAMLAISTAGCATARMAHTSLDGKSGTMTYYPYGASWLIEARKEKAKEKMMDFCHGPYHVLSDQLVNDGATAVAVPTAFGTVAEAEPVQIVAINFECPNK